MGEITKDSVQIARLEERIGHMNVEMANIRAELAEMDVKLDRVLTAFSEARGGWRTVMLICGAAAAAGSVITWLVAHGVFKGGPP